MLPKLEEFSIEELQEQLKDKKIDKEFLTEYIVKRDKVYNKLIDEVNRLRIEVSAREEVANKCEKVIKEAMEIVEYRLKENDGHINARMEMFHYRNLKEILSKGVE